MSILNVPPDWRERLNQHRRAPRPRWLRVLGWVWLGFTALTVVLIAAVAILLNNGRFHAYLIHTVEAQVAESLGVHVQLQNFALHPQSLTLDLYGVTIDGASPYQNETLLQVNHASASLRIVSLLSRTWYIENIQVDRPIARVYVDSHGVSNIPTIKSSGSSSNTSIFDLGVRHALLDQGEVYYNDKPSTLALDLLNIEFHSSFNAAAKQYTGSLKYSDGHLVYGAFRPVTHDLEAQFDATPSTFQLTHSQLTIGQSNAVISGTLNNYSNPIAQANYAVSVNGKQVGDILRNTSVPTGTIQTSGSVQFQQVANRSVLDSLVVNGTLSSDRLGVNTPSVHSEIAKLSGTYSLSNGNASLNDLRAALLGGELAADGSMEQIGGNSRGSFHAKLRDISLSELTRATGNATDKLNVGVSGRLSAESKATWGKSFDDLVAHVDATINGAVAAANRTTPRTINASTAAPSQIAVNSAIHATYTAKNGQLALDNSYLKTPQTALTMNGTVSNHSALNLNLQAHDLHELETIGALFEKPTPGKPVAALGLAGSASFQGTVRGSMTAPHLNGQLSASNLEVSGSKWKTIRTDVDLSPSSAALDHAVFEPASRGKITLTASAGLKKWSFTNTSPLQVSLQASQLDIAELARIAQQQVPVTGTANASISLHGTETDPIGNGNVSLTNLTAYDQPIRLVKVSFAGDGQKVDANLAVDLPTGSIQGKGTVEPKLKTYNAQLTASGIQLDKLQALKARNIDIAGVLGIDAHGSGSFDNPGGSLTLQIPKLVAQGQTISGLDLKANVADHKANATLSTSAVNTTIQAKATVDLSGDYMADASVDTQLIPLQPLVATYAPDQAGDVTGQTELHATLHGPLKKTNLLEAHLNIPVLKAGYGKSIELAAAAPIRADFKNGVVILQRSSIKGTDTDLQFEGSVPTSGNGPMSLLLLGTVNLQLAQLFVPDVKSGGQIKFNIDSHGPTNAADIGGEIDIVDASYSSPDLPVGLQHGNGVLKITKDRVNISSFNASVGGGTLTAQGGVSYRPAFQFNVGLAAKGIRVLYPQGMREGVDANLRLVGNTDSATLGGSVDLTDLSLTSAFDLDSFIGQFSGGVAAPPSPGLAQNLALNIAVRSTSNINLVSRAVSIGGSANLQVRGTAADPVILGRVNVNDGDIILNGTRFVLNGGTIQFINPSETEPVVNLSLNTSIQQYSIDLRFNGPVTQLHTEYSSDPALPAADIINLLAFGSTTEASAASPTPTNQAAESLVASQVSSQITSRVSKIAGISQLSISPVLAGSSSQGPPGAVITVQQRVTGNLFVNFSTNVASTQSQTIQGQYRISPKVSVSATRDPNGGYAFDALIKKTW